ncbi:MAG TPA: oligopeptide transporter, OPT family [Burkholderiales bacterium]|nr:oligopeptide transporter, OPT family [Burkholderiales bacterium]
MQPKQLELTIKALVIGLVLSLVFCGANVYLGLKIGQTVSASIPSAIVAMGFLRLFKKYSILENSISQTIASTGEAAATVVIFVFPALLILGIWKQFDYWSIVLVGLSGGLIGVIFSIILRKVLLADKTLAFPEGQAIGQVLLTTTATSDKTGLKMLVMGSIISALLSFFQTGLQVFASAYNKIFKIGNNLFGAAISFSPAMLGAGYLIGFNPTFVSFLAAIVAWAVFLPIFTSIHGIKDSADIVGSAFYTWKNYIRPIGIGVMIFAGIATITMLINPIIKGVKESLNALKNITHIDYKDLDLNIKKLFVVLIIASIPIVILIYNQLNCLTVCSLSINLTLSIAILFMVLIVGFIVSAVAGYFAGLIGSTNSPISGLLFIAVIAISIVLNFLTHNHSPDATTRLFITIVLLVAFIGFTSSITNSNIQDYQSGQIVGSTPYRQQIALFIGITVSVLVVPFFINLIFNAYGIAGIVPHPGIDPNNTLSAPQAAAVSMLAKNIINSSQDWSLIAYGIGIGLFALILDIIGKSTGKFRCPMLSIGIGLYLPPDLVGVLFIGGLLRIIVDCKQEKIRKTHGEEVANKLHSKSSLLICGLVAGESLMGLILAVPFVIKQSSDALKIVGDNFIGFSQILSVVVTLILFCYIYKTSTKTK